MGVCVFVPLIIRGFSAVRAFRDVAAGDIVATLPQLVDLF